MRTCTRTDDSGGPWWCWGRLPPLQLLLLLFLALLPLALHPTLLLLHRGIGLVLPSNERHEPRVLRLQPRVPIDLRKIEAEHRPALPNLHRQPLPPLPIPFLPTDDFEGQDSERVVGRVAQGADLYWRE